MNFSEAQKYLYKDGSFRDIYVLKTTNSQLDSFLDYIRPLISEADFLLDNKPTPLPSSYFGVMMDSQEASCTLRIPVQPGFLHCYFFDSSELELDFNPIDYSDEKSWNTLSDFLQGLANAMNREVIITPEDQPKQIYIRYNSNQ